MNPDTLPSSLLESAVAEVSHLPGIGRKTALRLVLHLLRRPADETFRLSESLRLLRENICYCSVCHNISEQEVCEICASPSRDKSVVCVVATVSDVMAIEQTMKFNGLYHVLGGVISPLEGVGPKDIEAESLFARVSRDGIREVILALSPTLEGDTTAMYIYRRLSSLDVLVTQIARGVAIGDALEYADEITLGRSLLARTAFAG